MPPKLDRAILFPSPNWFQVSGIKATVDGWVVYSGPNKSLCVLVPIPGDEEEEHVIGKPEEPSYHVHVVHRAHEEKLVSVDVSPEWPNKRNILTGSSDGGVKFWNVDHENNKITVRYNLTHNVHNKDKEEVVSVGFSTSQFAISVSVCGTLVKWNVTSNVTIVHRKLCYNLRPQCMACSPHLPLHVAIGTKQGVILLLNLTDKGQVIYKVRGHNDEVMNLSWCPQYEVLVNKSVQETLIMRLDKIRNDKDSVDITTCEELKTHDTDDDEAKHLDDSCPNESQIVEEEDLFDVYKDHEHEEFGHKKFVPEDIVVKVKEDKTKCEYLEDCQKLKHEILKRKNAQEPSIEELVEALDRTNVSVDDTPEEKEQPNENKSDTKCSVKEESLIGPKTVHIQKHMLVSISKNGNIQTWSKSGKQIGICTLSHSGGKQKNKPKFSNYVTVFWHKPDMLLASDHKFQVQQINPLELNAKNTMLYKPVHNIHKKLPYCIVSGSPRVQPQPDLTDYPVWSVSQDRLLVQYSLQQQKALLVNSTCGAFIYTVAACPYDARRIAASGGDGAVRVLSDSGSTNYWQNLQGKVLTVAWHPTRENLLAFGTAEARVGTLKAKDASDRPAKLLQAMSGAVYGLSWSPAALYACGGGELLRYLNGTGAPEVLPINIEGIKWHIAEVCWTSRSLLVGGSQGGVCVMTASYPHSVVAVAFPTDKVIHCMDWHPLHVSDSESRHKDLLAVSSYDKNIAIVKLVTTEEGQKSLVPVTSLVGHRHMVYKVQWSPHAEDTLLSTSQDGTVRIWQPTSSSCTHIFASQNAVLCASWASVPTAGSYVLSGGADCTLRLWDMRDYPKELYPDEPIKRQRNKRKGARTDTADTAKEKEPNNSHDEDECPSVAAEMDRHTAHCRKFLLPVCQKELNTENLNACKMLLQKYISEKENTNEATTNKVTTNEGTTNEVTTNEETTNEVIINEGTANEERTEVNNESLDTNYIKMFGNINEVNELLDLEQSRHESTVNHEAWLMLAMFRGRVTDMIQYATDKSILSPFLVSLAPAVSYKYWKDVAQLYVSQIERLYAARKENKQYESRRYGGAVFQRAALQLATSDVRAAVSTLVAVGLYKEAYVLTRARHCSDLAQDVLRQWRPRAPTVAAPVLEMALGNLPAAAANLAKSKQPEYLSLAVQIATASGQTLLANYISERLELIKLNAGNTEEILAELPSRLNVMLNLNEEEKSLGEDEKNTEENGKENSAEENGKENSADQNGKEEGCQQNGKELSSHQNEKEVKSDIIIKVESILGKEIKSNITELKELSDQDENDGVGKICP